MSRSTFRKKTANKLPTEKPSIYAEATFHKYPKVTAASNFKEQRKEDVRNATIYSYQWYGQS